MKMAKANQDEVERLRVFMSELEEKLNQGGDLRNIGEWVFNNFPDWRRVVEGYPILVENACDPALSYLEWKPELKQFVEESKGVEP